MPRGALPRNSVDVSISSKSISGKALVLEAVAIEVMHAELHRSRRARARMCSALRSRSRPARIGEARPVMPRATLIDVSIGSRKRSANRPRAARSDRGANRRLRSSSRRQQVGAEERAPADGPSARTPPSVVGERVEVDRGRSSSAVIADRTHHGVGDPAPAAAGPTNAADSRSTTAGASVGQISYARRFSSAVQRIRSDECTMPGATPSWRIARSTHRLIGRGQLAAGRRGSLRSATTSAPAEAVRVGGRPRFRPRAAAAEGTRALQQGP